MTKRDYHIMAWTLLFFGWVFGFADAPYLSLGFFVASAVFFCLRLLKDDFGGGGPLKPA